MNTKTLLSRTGAVFALSLFAAFGFALAARAASVFDIEYPVQELGGCADRTECKAYCEDEVHEEECDEFAAKYGLGSGQGASGAKDDRREAIAADGGPGGCARDSKDPEKSCHQYCSVQSHMRECVTYAKEKGFMKGKELEEAEKVLRALDSGATLPAGCTDQESCHETCENSNDVKTMRECFAFAEKAGLLPDDVDREKAEKMFSLIESGKAPFKSPKEFEQCKNPASDEIFDKCLRFALENDFIPKEEAEMIRKTGGKGPGGCRGKEQCDAYCEAHQDECFAFAEEHDLIPPEEKAKMKENMSRMSESLKNAPQEVQSCLNQKLGEAEVAKVLDGTTIPRREFAEAMRSCFEANRPNMEGAEGEQGEFGDPNRMGPPNEGMPGGRGQGMQFPPEVRSCIESKLSGDALQEFNAPKGRPSSEVESAIRECFSSMQGQKDSQGEFREGEWDESGPGSKSRDGMNPEEIQRVMNERGERPGGPQGQPGQFDQNRMPREGGRPEDGQRFMNEGSFQGKPGEFRPGEPYREGMMPGANAGGSMPDGGFPPQGNFQPGGSGDFRNMQGQFPGGTPMPPEGFNPQNPSAPETQPTSVLDRNDSLASPFLVLLRGLLGR